MMFPGYPDYGYMTWMMLGSVVLWVALIALVAFALAKLLSRADGDEALATLKQRLARGEINAEEYKSHRSLILGR